MSHTHTPKWHMCALWMTQLAISSSIEQWNTAKILLPTGQWQTSIQPFSIHLTTSPLHSGAKRVGDAYPSWLSSSPRGHTGRQTTTCTHSLWEFRVPSSPLEHVFGPWEEDGVPPHADRGTTCTHAKTPWPGIEPTTFPLRGDGANHCTVSLQLQVNNLFPINNTIRSRLE